MRTRGRGMGMGVGSLGIRKTGVKIKSILV
jgi:hypothetical protein